MAYKLVFSNIKGGVGKSTSALNTADQLMNLGKKVLMVDTDPQRNTTEVYRAKTEGVATLEDIFTGGYTAEQCIQHTEYGDIIASDYILNSIETRVEPSNVMYKYILKAFKGIENQYDFIIFDTPPKFGLLVGNVFKYADGVICPVTCDYFGIQGITDFYKVITEFQEDNEKLKVLGLLMTKYKGKQNLTADIEQNILPKYAATMNSRVFKHSIRECVKCSEAQTLHLRLSNYAPYCNTALDYELFVKELLGVIENECQ